MLPVACGRTDLRFESVLPAVVNVEAFLFGKAEVAFVPFAVGLEEAEVLAEFADEDGFLVRHGQVVGGPGVAGDFIFAVTGVASSFAFHFEQDEVAEAFLMKAPSGGESGAASADDDEGDFAGLFRLGERAVVAEFVAEGEGVVDELAVEAAVRFGGQPHEEEAAGE